MTFKAKMTAMAAILAAAGVMAQAQAAEVYNVGSNMAFAPFEYVDENNQPAGFEMELIVAIAKAQGAEVKLHNVPFDGLFPLFKQEPLISPCPASPLPINASVEFFSQRLIINRVWR